MRKAGSTTWKGSAIYQAQDVVTGPTPPASSAALMQLDRAPLELATTPYVGPALVFDAASGNRRYWRQTVGMAAEHARLWAAIPIGSATNTQVTIDCTSETGGEAGNNIITHPMPKATTPPANVFSATPYTNADYTGLVVDDAPAAPRDRQLELLASLSPPAPERFSCDGPWAVSVMVSAQVADLESL